MVSLKLHATISDMVGGWFVDLTVADNTTAGGPAYREKIEEIDSELTKVTEDFGRAVNIEALRLAKNAGTHLLFRPGNMLFSVISCRAAVFA